MSSALTDADLEQLGITREQAERIGELVDEHGEFTEAERDQLAVLLRPRPAAPLPRNASPREQR